MARNRIAERHYQDGNGEWHRSPQPDTVGLRFGFFDGSTDSEGKPTVGTTMEWTESDFGVEKMAKGLPRQGFWHGVNQKLGDGFSGAKGDVEKAMEGTQELSDRLKAGEWLTESEGGGPRGDTILAEAIERVLSQSLSGDDLESRMAAVREKLNDDDKEAAKKYAAGAKARPDVAAAYEAIKVERAQERLAKKQAAAEQGTGEDAMEL